MNEIGVGWGGVVGLLFLAGLWAYAIYAEGKTDAHYQVWCSEPDGGCTDVAGAKTLPEARRIADRMEADDPDSDVGIFRVERVRR